MEAPDNGFLGQPCPIVNLPAFGKLLRFNEKAALKIKREQFIRTWGLREAFPSCKFDLNFFSCQVRNRSFLTFIIIKSLSSNGMENYASRCGVRFRFACWFRLKRKNFFSPKLVALWLSRCLWLQISTTLYQCWGSFHADLCTVCSQDICLTHYRLN